MDPLNSGFWQRAKASRFSFSLVTLATLALGILIGTVITYGVKGKTIDSSDAQQLTVPQAKQISNAFSSVAKQLEPSVVNINTESVVKNPHRGLPGGPRGRTRPSPNNPPGGDDDQQDQQQSPQQQDPDSPFQDFMDRFFGGQGGQSPRPAGRHARPLAGIRRHRRSQGLHRDQLSTWSIRPTTSASSLMGDPPTVQLRSQGHRHRSGDRPGRYQDRSRRQPLPAAKIGNSDGMNVGDWVLAIGSPFGLEETVTAGIVSAKGRNIVPADASSSPSSRPMRPSIPATPAARWST